MALQPTALSLTPTWDEKRLGIAGGSPAVHEKVAITLVGGATALGAVPAGLALRIHSAGSGAGGVPPWHALAVAATSVTPVEFARFPSAANDVWVVSDDDLTCAIDLNTAMLDAVFAGRAYDAIVDAVVVVESGTADNLYAAGRLRIRNWIINTDDPILGSSVLKTRVDALETALDAETETRQTADTDEELARAEADTALGVRIDASATAAALSQEVSDRTLADIAEAEARAAADGVLTDAIDAKVAQSALTAEAQARIAADSDEADARIAADGVLTLAVSACASAVALNAEVVARGVAVEAEAQARTLADGALEDLIAFKQAAPSAGALATLAGLDALPEEFTENEFRLWANALLSAVKGLYA